MSAVSIDGGKPAILMLCGGLVYYHCAIRNSSLVSLIFDVFIVILCSLAVVGLLFQQMNIQVPVEPLDWQISQDTANAIFAGLANTIGAAESVLRVASTGHDKRFFFKVFSAIGRLFTGATVAFTATVEEWDEDEFEGFPESTSSPDAEIIGSTATSDSDLKSESNAEAASETVEPS